MDAKEASYRWVRQGLDGSLLGADAATVLAVSGWARSVGGAGPYQTLLARAGLRRPAIDEAVASCAIAETPAARHCTYVVRAQDFALALRRTFSLHSPASRRPRIDALRGFSQ